MMLMMTLKMTMLKAVDVSGIAEDLMLMTRDNQALTSELLVVKDKMS